MKNVPKRLVKFRVPGLNPCGGFFFHVRKIPLFYNNLDLYENIIPPFGFEPGTRNFTSLFGAFFMSKKLLIFSTVQGLINFDFVSINFWTKSNSAMLYILWKVCKKEYWNLQEVFNLYQYWMTNVLSALNKINYRLWWQLWGLQFPEDFQKFRNAGRHWRPGLQSWKPNREEEKARKLLKGELWGTHLFSKGRRRSKLQMEIKETFLCPCYLAFKRKIHASLKIIHFQIINQITKPYRVANFS